MKKIIFIIVICFSLLGMTQDHSETIMTQESTKISLSDIQRGVDKEINSLRNKILDNREQALENKNTINNLSITKVGLQTILISLLLSLLGFFGLGYYLKLHLTKKISKNVIFLETECEESLRKVEKIKDEALLRIQNTEIENDNLRKTTEILIISETATRPNDTIEKIFIKSPLKVAFNCMHIRIKELSFSQVEDELEGYGNILPRDFDMVVIDNCDAENRYWEGDHFNKYIFKFTKSFLSKGIGVLFFSNDQNFPAHKTGFRDLPNRYLLVYAKSHAQLYTNAMNLLKLKNLYNPKKKKHKS